MKLFNRKHEAIEARHLTDEVVAVERVMARYPEGRELAFGAPTRCPECGEWGLVDEVRGGVAANHCYRCGEEWIITVRALRAVAAAAQQVPLGVPKSDDVGIVYDEKTASRSAAATPRLALKFSTTSRVQIIGA